MRRITLFISIIIAATPFVGDDAIAQSPSEANITPAAFARLKWLDGKWRGVGTSGTRQAPFYERYRFVDDSTLVFGSYADSTFTRVSGTGRHEARRGRLTNVGQGPRWIAVRLDEVTVVFAPLERAENWLTWRRESTDQWTAILEWKTAEGTERRLDYRMNGVP